MGMTREDFGADLLDEQHIFGMGELYQAVRARARWG
jgi:hypothetical protein